MIDRVEMGLEQRLKEAVKKEYDQSDAWLIETHPFYYVYQHEFSEIAKFIQVTNCKNALDSGAGRGRFTELLTDISDNVYCVDFSPTMIEILKEKFKERKNIFVVQADAKKLPFSDNFFDLIISVQLLGHLPSPVNGLKEMSRVLKKGGQLIISIGNLFSLIELKQRCSLIGTGLKNRNIERFYFTNDTNCWLSRRNFCRYSYWTLRKMLKGSGFKVTKSSGAGLADIKNNKVARKLESFSNLFPCKYFSHFVIISSFKAN